MHLLLSLAAGGGKNGGSNSASAKRKRESSLSSGLLTFVENSKRVKKELSGANGKGKGREGSEDGFKVPPLPSRSYSQSSLGRTDPGSLGSGDVFGSDTNNVSGGKAITNGLDELEKANKTVGFCSWSMDVVLTFSFYFPFNCCR